MRIDIKMLLINRLTSNVQFESVCISLHRARNIFAIFLFALSQQNFKILGGKI